MKKKFVLLAGALLACIPTWSMADDQYDLVQTMVSETGVQTEDAWPVGDGSFSACVMARNKAVLPRTIPRGAIISPGGNSYEWAITAVSCRLRTRK